MKKMTAPVACTKPSAVRNTTVVTSSKAKPTHLLIALLHRRRRYGAGRHRDLALEGAPTDGRPRTRDRNRHVAGTVVEALAGRQAQARQVGCDEREPTADGEAAGRAIDDAIAGRHRQALLVGQERRQQRQIAGRSWAGTRAATCCRRARTVQLQALARPAVTRCGGDAGGWRRESRRWRGGRRRGGRRRDARRRGRRRGLGKARVRLRARRAETTRAKHTAAAEPVPRTQTTYSIKCASAQIPNHSAGSAVS